MTLQTVYIPSYAPGNGLNLTVGVNIQSLQAYRNVSGTAPTRLRGGNRVGGGRPEIVSSPAKGYPSTSRGLLLTMRYSRRLS